MPKPGAGMWTAATVDPSRSRRSIIDRLVDKGLVERAPDPEDRRVVICRLTPTGREAVEAFWRIGRLRIVSLAEKLDNSELEKVVQAMELLCRATEDL